MRKALKNQTRSSAACQAVVIWIDWYAYHLARFEGLQQAFGRDGEVVGIEMVGGIGVHAGLNFRGERDASLPVETLMPAESWNNASKVKLAQRLWRRLSELDPQVVMVPGYYTLPAIAAAMWARLHGRVSMLMTESTAGDHVRTGWKETIKSLTIRTLFNCAVTGGTAHARYLEQLHFPTDRIGRFYDVVGNGVLAAETSCLREAGSPARHDLPEQYFLFVGRLAPEKNVRGLLEAWISYRRAGGSWSLVLAGDGPESGDLHELTRQTDFGADVYFAGHRSATELPRFFAFASCFVLPSTREPWGLVVNEAMAAGLPVIVSTRCGCAEDLVIPGMNGMVFDPAMDGQLLERLHDMEKLLPAARTRMGAETRKRIAPFSPANFGREVQNVAALAGSSARKPEARSRRQVAS